MISVRKKHRPWKSTRPAMVNAFLAQAASACSYGLALALLIVGGAAAFYRPIAQLDSGSFGRCFGVLVRGKVTTTDRSGTTPFYELEESERIWVVGSAATTPTIGSTQLVLLRKRFTATGRPYGEEQWRLQLPASWALPTTRMPTAAPVPLGAMADAGERCSAIVFHPISTGVIGILILVTGYVGLRLVAGVAAGGLLGLATWNSAVFLSTLVSSSIPPVGFLSIMGLLGFVWGFAWSQFTGSPFAFIAQRATLVVLAWALAAKLLGAAFWPLIVLLLLISIALPAFGLASIATGFLAISTGVRGLPAGAILIMVMVVVHALTRGRWLADIPGLSRVCRPRMHRLPTDQEA